MMIINLKKKVTIKMTDYENIQVLMIIELVVMGLVNVYQMPVMMHLSLSMMIELICSV